MPENKLGSKLAQGVRQVQSKQVEATSTSPTVEVSAVTVPAAEPKTRRKAPPRAKPSVAASNATEKKEPFAPSSEYHQSLHPQRVWPD